ncbi:MAG: hypothetical protein ACI9BD_000200 [Candidatus Marinamargulisbacteria bacterium]|jgi:hypothetical protein
MADVDLDKSDQRITAGTKAGDDYTVKLESIRNKLDADADAGTTLGTMVGAQLEMTEAETRYQVTAGIPKKASSSVAAAAGDVKKAAGS